MPRTSATAATIEDDIEPVECLGPGPFTAGYQRAGAPDRARAAFPAVLDGVTPAQLMPRARAREIPALVSGPVRR